MRDERTPVIRLALGEHISEIQARSTYRFDLKDLSAVDFVGATTPVVFEYARRGCRFVLPPAPFVFVGLDAGHAVYARVSPHPRLLTLEESFDLLEGLAEVFEEAGWRQTAEHLATPDERQDVFEELEEVYADPATAEQHAADFGDWRCDAGDELYVTLRRDSRAGSAGLFIATVNIENEKLSEQYGREAAGRGEEDADDAEDEDGDA